MNERELFLSALEIEEPVARRAHLQAACAGDTELLNRVEALLKSHEAKSQFLNTPIVEQIETDGPNKPATTVFVENGSTEDNPPITSDPIGPDFMIQDIVAPTDEVNLAFLQSSSNTDSLGRLGHYDVSEVIGCGAFGTVLKAFDEKLQRIVAIKVLAPEMAVTSPARKRFLREARSSAAIRHENVVNIYAVEDTPIPYLVMEYIPGQTLQQKLDEHGPLELPDVLRFGKQIADGLAAAHARQLIHRDVKPGNILLESGLDDHIKITDFGLARTADDASVTQSGTIAGTPLYMAPEQASGERLDQRADLFSLGSVLYLMLTGRPPFRAPTTAAVLNRVSNDAPRPIREIIPEVPEWMCQLIDRLHAKNPDDRYGSAKEVSDLLAKCLVDIQEGRIPVITNAPGVSLGPESVETTRWNDVQRHLKRPLVTLAAFLMLAVVGLGITEATGMTNIVSTAIRVTTGAGTLVIETDDPNVKVTIDGEDITIRGAGVEELTLRPGEYKVSAVKDGKPLKQEIVTITRNGRAVVRMSLEPAISHSQAVGPKFTPHHQWPRGAPGFAIAPFDEANARDHQQEWAKYLGVPVEKVVSLSDSIKMKMILIPPGEFLMGSTRQEQEHWLEEAKVAKDQAAIGVIPREGPQHRVRLTRPFYLAVHEVTQEQYRQVTGANPSRLSVEGDGKVPEVSKQTVHHPVDNVSWFDAIVFCNKLSELEKRRPCYEITDDNVTVVPGNGYRLPSEAEWEYACRAGSTSTYSFGDENRLGDYAWYGANSKKLSHPVSEKLPNQFGLVDMHGSIWEWCQDWHSPRYYTRHDGSGNVIDPIGPSRGTNRVLRGGYWNSPAWRCRSAYRYSGQPNYHNFYIGFRFAAVVEKF